MTVGCRARGLISQPSDRVVPTRRRRQFVCRKRKEPGRRIFLLRRRRNALTCRRKANKSLACSAFCRRCQVARASQSAEKQSAKRASGGCGESERRECRGFVGVARLVALSAAWAAILIPRVLLSPIRPRGSARLGSSEPGRGRAGALTLRECLLSGLVVVVVVALLLLAAGCCVAPVGRGGARSPRTRFILLPQSTRNSNKFIIERRRSPR